MPRIDSLKTPIGKIIKQCLDNNDGYCMDNNWERIALAKALLRELHIKGIINNETP